MLTPPLQGRGLREIDLGQLRSPRTTIKPASQSHPHSPTSPFTHFAVADWSGAKGTRHPGIALAVCARGAEAPELVSPPERHWSRSAIADWVIGRARAGERVLIGFDFSFAPPWRAAGYLPGRDTPADAPGFWAWLDARAADEEDLGAARWMEGDGRAHFYFGAADGDKARFMVARACEDRLRATGGSKPSTVFDAIGAAQVAKASFAGMRLLHRLRAAGVPVWPFDPVPDTGPLVVEIYTSLAARAAGRATRQLKLRSNADLNAALEAVGSRPFGGPANEHEADATLTAAWLRQASGDSTLWRAPVQDPRSTHEGWTFGVA